MVESFPIRLRATSLFRATSSVLVPLAAAVLGGGSDAHAQQIRGRVVAEQSRSALADATVTLYAAADSALIERAGTAADGFFTVRAPGPGTYRIVVELLGYAQAERSFRLGDQSELVVAAFVLHSLAIALDPVTAAGRVRGDSSSVAVGFRRATHLLAAERLAVLERVGTSMAGVVRELGAGLRVHEVQGNNVTRAKYCVESSRRMVSFRGDEGNRAACNMIAIVLDGVTIPDPLAFFQNLNVRDFESIEYVPPAEAGTLYGMEASTYGALVLWSRGNGPHRSRTRGGGENGGPGDP